MKTLSITQPWATLIAIGAKGIETRSWSTDYRGELAVHAAKGFPRYARETLFEEVFRVLLEAAGYQTAADLPLGCVVATCNLVRVHRIQLGTDVPCAERPFGNYAIGRYMWVIENVVALPEPVPAKGALGLWKWEGGAR